MTLRTRAWRSALKSVTGPGRIYSVILKWYQRRRQIRQKNRGPFKIAPAGKLTFVGGPRAPQRNTLLDSQGPNNSAASALAARASRDIERGDRFFSPRYSGYESYESDHPSRLGDESSLFSTSGPEVPKPPNREKTDSSVIEVFGGRGTDSSPFTFDPHTPQGTHLNPFTVSSSPAASMVVEREPPKSSPEKAAPVSTFQNPLQPEFGKSSPLRNVLKPNPNIFNVPNPRKPRPEHHLSAAHKHPQAHHVQSSQAPTFDPYRSQPSLQPPPTNENREVGIIRPSNPPLYSSIPRKPPQPMFQAHPKPASYVAPPKYISEQHLTNFSQPRPGQFDDPLLWQDHFEEEGPLAYVSSEKANEDIKALLEGNIEDEEEKPRIRGRKKLNSQKAVDALSDKFSNLEVKAEEAAEQQPEEEEGDEDVDDGTVEGLSVKLLPHQVEGAEWMRARELGGKTQRGVKAKGGILADDMGLGKTIQSLALILTNPRPPVTSVTSVTDKKTIGAEVGKNTLVVAPLALIRQWESEIKDKVSESHKLRVLVHHGQSRTKRFQDLKKYDVVITTYQILVSEHASSSEREDGPQFGCFGLHWYRVILDEAHTIKNRNAKSSQAACALRSEYRWCLTGTPMQNNLDELQSLVKFLRIRPFNELSVWRDQITRPMNQGKGALAIRRLQSCLKAFMKRRTKDVLKQEGALNPGGKSDSKTGNSEGFKITARNVESLVAEFSLEERKFYDGLEQRTDQSLERMMDAHKLNYASALVLLLRLRQACNHPDLVGGSMAKDKDALTTGKTTSSQASAKSKDEDLDSMANLFGGLSVQTRQCDVCMTDLSEEELASKMKRCAGCEDLVINQDVAKAKKPKHRKKHHHQSVEGKSQNSTKPRSRRKQFVVDDSDGEGEGERIVPKEENIPVLGKAGGIDDENAEGGGEWLGSSSETEDDSEIKPTGSQREPISLNSSGSESNSESDRTEISDSEQDSDPAFDAKSPVTSAKIRQLLPILTRDSTSHKIIVFSVFTSMLDLIEPHLRSARFKYTRYDGSMRNDLREASLERLRNDKSCRILLCSLKCGSLGLNLTAASRVIILEPFWNPFVEEQAIDRVHRLNQTRDVVVYKLTVKGTVEERILELQEKKRALANAAFGGKEKAGKLSMEDMLRLFKRDAEHDPSHGGDLPVGVGVEKGGVLHKKAEGSQGGSGSRRVTPPVAAEKARAAPREDPVYGRRW